MSELVNISIKKQVATSPSAEELLISPTQYGLHLYVDEMESTLNACIKAYIEVSFQVEHILRHVSCDAFRAQEVNYIRKKFLKSWEKVHQEFKEELKESLAEISDKRKDDQEITHHLTLLTQHVIKYFAVQTTYIADKIIVETHMK